jgi:DNA-binding IclR family transcriptional regulator
MGTLGLSNKLGIHKSTISRLCSVLTYYGLLQQDPLTKKYRLGKTSSDMGRAVSKSLTNHLVKVAQPLMDQLRDSVGESVSLEALTGDSVILVNESHGPLPVSVAFSTGSRVPIHVSSGAKAILAFSSPEVVDRLISKKLKRFTPNTITDRKAFKRHLEKIRSKGVSIDRGEYSEDLVSIGSPIFDHTGKVIASISVCSPTFRMTKRKESKMISLIKETAAVISERLFYSQELS